MLLLLLAMLQDRRASERSPELPLDLDIDLDPLASFAERLALRPSGPRAWRGPHKQVFLDEERLRFRMALPGSALRVHRRSSPMLTGKGLDLLLEVQEDTQAEREVLEFYEALTLQLCHGEDVEIVDGELRWETPLGDVHSFSPSLPEPPKVAAQLARLRLLGKALLGKAQQESAASGAVGRP